MDFETLENEVLAILKYNETARADDMALYANYVFNHVKDDLEGDNWLVRVFSDRRYRIQNGISPYSSVSRCRRKLQEKHPELKPSAKVIKERKESEERYKAYALKDK